MFGHCRLKYIFVAGVEGCGHHGLHPVIESAVRDCEEVRGGGETIVQWRTLKSRCNDLWCRPHGFAWGRRRARRRLERLFAGERERAERNAQTRVIIEDNSFPAGRYRDVERQWNLAEMLEIAATYADVRFFGLYRDPRAMSFSHCEWDGGLLGHAQMLRRHLEALDHQLASLEPELLRIVHYEDLIDAQEPLAEVVASHLGIRTDEVIPGFRHVRPSKKNWRAALNPHERSQLEQIFSPQAAERWPILSHAPRLGGGAVGRDAVVHSSRRP